MEAPELPEPDGLFPHPSELPVPVLGFHTLRLPEDDVSGGGRAAFGQDPPRGHRARPGDPRPASPVSPQSSGAEELLGLTVNPDIACGLGTGPEPPRPDGAPPVLLEVICDLSTPLDPALLPGTELSPHRAPDPLPAVSPCTPQFTPDPPSSPQTPPNSPQTPPQSIPVPQLRLTEEEKRLLAQEGVTLPGDLPLTQVCAGTRGAGRDRGGTGVTPPCPRPRSGS